MDASQEKINFVHYSAGNVTGCQRIFGPKREKVAGGWRRLDNEELHNLYASPFLLLGLSNRGERYGQGV
jgi:hypothetical protein